MINFDNYLLNKTCSPYHGKVTPLTTDSIQKLFLSLDNGWSINSDGRLFREYKFTNFLKAMDFANKITSIAEAEKHHPSLKINR